MVRNIRNEPALVVALLQAALVVAVSFGVEVSTQQMSAIVALLAAAAALFVRKRVTPLPPSGGGGGAPLGADQPATP